MINKIISLPLVCFLFSLAMPWAAAAQSAQQLVLESASQSSTGFGGVASRAVDGNTSGVWRQGTVTHTGSGDTQAWWGASFAEPSSVATIELWNRTNCCSSRLADFYVFLSDSPFASTDVTETLEDPDVWSYYHAGAVGEFVSVPVNVTGQYVRVQLTGSGYLSLAELIAFGEPGVVVPPPVNSQLVLSSAAQSSTGFGGVPARALDGNTNGAWRSSTLTHTNREAQPWWSAELEGVAQIDEVTLWNRTDGTLGNRLTDFYLLVSQTPFATDDLSESLNASDVWYAFHAGAAGRSVTIPVDAPGRYVRIQLQGASNPLTLAEVEVFGELLPPPPPPVPNQPPIADAGADQVLEFGADLTLDGGGSADIDGSIAGYMWSENGIEIGSGEVVVLTDLSAGPHTINLLVTDNDGATATDSLVVTVNELPNELPIAIAGVDQTVEFGVDVTLDGSASADSDGSIASYVWSCLLYTSPSPRD